MIFQIQLQTTNNLDIIYAIFIGIMVSSAYLFIIGKFSIRAIAKIADIPNRFLYPSVVILCIFGAYAVNNSSFDILIMAIMGGVGYVMLRLGVPAAPFLIAFILGPMLEDNFRQSLILSDGTYSIFFRNAICWVFWSLTFTSLALLVRSNLQAKSQS